MSTREKLLKIGAQEFAKHGYDGVSLNDIVQRVGINKATIYHHFKDKQALYHEIIKNEITKFHKNLDSTPIDEYSGEKLLERYIHTVVEILKDNPHIIPMALREIANFGSNIDENIVSHLEKGIEYLSAIMKKLKLKPKYEAMDSYTLYCFIDGTIYTFYSIQMSSLPFGSDLNLKKNNIKTLEYIGDYVTNMLLDALVEKE